MMRVVVIDDEPLARLAVTARLARRDGFTVVAEYGDGESAANGVLALRPDLVFVDISMPGISGLDLLAALPLPVRPMAILLTAHDDFAVQAFALDVLDYLLKPVDDDRFDEALVRAVRAFPYRCQGGGTPVSAAPPLRTFAARVGTRTVLVSAADVERIEADGDYATLHVGAKTYLVRERLATLAERLDPQQFQRVHRSCIVRLDMVSELQALTNRDALLRLRDGSLLRASRTYTPALMDAIGRRTVTT